MVQKLPVIKVVGVSAGGKSTLVRALREHGYDARAVSQEHSHSATLWKQFDVPRVLDLPGLHASKRNSSAAPTSPGTPPTWPSNASACTMRTPRPTCVSTRRS